MTKACPIDRSPPTRPHPLIFPKQVHQLRTNYSKHMEDHSHSNHHTWIHRAKSGRQERITSTEGNSSGKLGWRTSPVNCCLRKGISAFLLQLRTLETVSTFKWETGQISVAFQCRMQRTLPGALSLCYGLHEFAVFRILEDKSECTLSLPGRNSHQVSAAACCRHPWGWSVSPNQFEAPLFSSIPVAVYDSRCELRAAWSTKVLGFTIAIVLGNVNFYTATMEVLGRRCSSVADHEQRSKLLDEEKVCWIDDKAREWHVFAVGAIALQRLKKGCTGGSAFTSRRTPFLCQSDKNCVLRKEKALNRGD